MIERCLIPASAPPAVSSFGYLTALLLAVRPGRLHQHDAGGRSRRRRAGQLSCRGHRASGTRRRRLPAQQRRGPPRRRSVPRRYRPGWSSSTRSNWTGAPCADYARTAEQKEVYSSETLAVRPTGRPVGVPGARCDRCRRAARADRRAAQGCDRPDARIGSSVFDPGGPGASGMDTVAYMVASPVVGRRPGARPGNGRDPEVCRGVEQLLRSRRDSTPGGSARRCPPCSARPMPSGTPVGRRPSAPATRPMSTPPTPRNSRSPNCASSGPAWTRGSTARNSWPTSEPVMWQRIWMSCGLCWATSS